MTAEAKMVIERNFATLSLISHIINDKYVKAVPLYRLEKDLAYWGINFSRQTMHNLDIAAAEMMIPLYELIQKL